MSEPISSPSSAPSTAPYGATHGPGVSRLICVASEKYPRFSEADVAVLNDGRLLLAVGRKDGASDFAPGTIIGFRSLDAGVSWDDEPHVIQGPFEDVKDLMSVSFARTPRGLHLFFLGRGPDVASDTRVYQMLSADEGRTWSKPVRVSGPGYHVVNNARVVRTTAGRIVIPSAFVDGDIHKLFNQQRVFCFLSDDDGQTWRQSSTLAIPDKPMMEPGVAECADGSLYMTIRTAEGVLYEARSRDGGQTWVDFGPTTLPAPAAPSTVTRDPGSDDLWLFWCDRPKANWKGRSRIVVAASQDHGRTWGERRVIEDDPQRSFGYTSVTRVGDHVVLTYYDWRNKKQDNFHLTSLRQRTIPLAWLRGQVVPPVFRTLREPVLKRDQAWEGRVISMNSGLVAEKDRWRAWYTTGTLGPDGEYLRVCLAESRDQGLTWAKTPRPDAPVPNTNVVLPLADDPSADCYHASVHRLPGEVLALVWRRAKGGQNGLHSYVSADDGQTFRRDPDRPLVCSHNAAPEQKALAGEGRIANDAFDVLHDPDGTWAFFAAKVRKAADEREVIEHDNAAGLVREIARATSADAVDFSPTDVVIEADHGEPYRDPFDTQFYAMQVFRRRGFHLGLLQTYHVAAQTIQPEWAWSHDGASWARTRTKAIPLGDEEAFDSRMILFGALTVVGDQLVWLYSGYDWRHNAFKKGEVSSAVGRAVLPLAELDAWLDTLPQP